MPGNKYESIKVVHEFFTVRITGANNPYRIAKKHMTTVKKLLQMFEDAS